MKIQRSSLASLTVLGCLLFSFSLTAQDYRPGYIVKSKSDSISGFILYKAGNKEYYCSFKVSKKSEAVSFSPDNLLGYGFNEGGKYVSLVLPGSGSSGDKVFVRVLSEGPLTLYRYGKSFFVKKDEILELPYPTSQIVDPVEIGATTAQKRAINNKMEKKDKRYVGVLNRLLADCRLKADEVPYYEKELTAIVNKYNRCKGFTQSNVKLKPLSRLNVGFLGGYVTSALEVKESAVVPFSTSDVNFGRSKTVIGGISLDLSSPRLYDRLFLTIEGWYSKSVFIGTDYEAGSLQDITIDVSSVRMFLGMRYNLLHESHTPYLKVGISGTITQDLNLKSTLETENPNGDVFYSDDLSGTYFEKKVRGYWFGIGYDQLVVGKMKAFAELRMERADAYFGTPITPDSKLNTLSVLVGIRF